MVVVDTELYIVYKIGLKKAENGKSYRIVNFLLIIIIIKIIQGQQPGKVKEILKILLKTLARMCKFTFVGTN